MQGLRRGRLRARSCGLTAPKEVERAPGAGARLWSSKVALRCAGRIADRQKRRIKIRILWVLRISWILNRRQRWLPLRPVRNAGGGCRAPRSFGRRCRNWISVRHGILRSSFRSATECARHCSPPREETVVALFACHAFQRTYSVATLCSSTGLFFDATSV